MEKSYYFSNHMAGVETPFTEGDKEFLDWFNTDSALRCSHREILTRIARAHMKMSLEEQDKYIDLVCVAREVHFELGQPLLLLCPPCLRRDDTTHYDDTFLWTLSKIPTENIWSLQGYIMNRPVSLIH